MSSLANFAGTHSEMLTQSTATNEIIRRFDEIIC